MRVIDAEVRGRLSYLGANQPVPPMESPYDVFDRIFAGGARARADAGARRTAADPRAERLRAQRKSVLDFLGQELAAGARPAWAPTIAPRIDAHLESVRDIERRLAAVAVAAAPARPHAAGCQAPAAGRRGWTCRPAANMPAVGKLQMDLLAAALACDLTRVATLQWTHAESNQTFPFIGVTGQHHAMSHAGDGDAAAQENLTKINVWYAEQLRYLLDRLASYREGDAHPARQHAWCSGRSRWARATTTPTATCRSCWPAARAADFRTGRFVDYHGRRRPGPAAQQPAGVAGQRDGPARHHASATPPTAPARCPVWGRARLPRSRPIVRLAEQSGRPAGANRTAPGALLLEGQQQPPLTRR